MIHPQTIWLPYTHLPTTKSSPSVDPGRTRFQISMVKSVLALLNTDVRELISAAIMAANIRPFKPVVMDTELWLTKLNCAWTFKNYNILNLWQKIWKLQNVPINLKRNNWKTVLVSRHIYMVKGQNDNRNWKQWLIYSFDNGRYILMKMVGIFVWLKDNGASIAMLHLDQIHWGVDIASFKPWNVSWQRQYLSLNFIVKI